MTSTVLWFRHGLRLHDNPSLHEALKDNIRRNQQFFPIFIFDGETAGTKLVGYNRMKFLLESLEDLNKQFRAVGGRLYLFKNKPINVFKALKERLNLKLLCFEQDCEPVWRVRDETVKSLCHKIGVNCVEHVSHTLWNPFKVIEENGGSPPLTYQSFMYVVSTIGEPPRPVKDVDWTGVKFGDIPDDLAEELNMLKEVPTPEDFGYYNEFPNKFIPNQWKGGETKALENLEVRLDVEEAAFRRGYFLPNHADPDLLSPPTSQSAALRFGCLSVRRFYWSIHDLYKNIHGDNLPKAPHITGQLIWREYFYTMSVNNEYYVEMERNPICLNIPWSEPNKHELDRWKYGKTGFPFIDAAMRQLLLEGWIHHVARNAVACFLTRGDLWISWEYGLQHFFKYLLDADWSVCAGNWMWVSSSAFEQLLDCSECICPVAFGRRLDPEGEYVKRYIPELKYFPAEYLYEPWKAPLDVQKKAQCIIGQDYPEPMVNHVEVSKRNNSRMRVMREATMGGSTTPPHCRPSNEDEAKQFLGLPNECHNHCVTTQN